MNYTIEDANKIRVGDTLTLEDGSVHEAVKDNPKILYNGCQYCSINPCQVDGIRCNYYSFHFKQINP